MPKKQKSNFMPDGCLDIFGAAWAGCRIEKNIFICPEYGELAAGEIRMLPWLKQQWSAEIRRLKQTIARAGIEDAIFFTEEEWRYLREALRLLDVKLPGQKLQAIAIGRRRYF